MSRREFTSPQEDRDFLEEYGLPWETIIDGSPWVLLHDFPTPEGYNIPKVSVAIRLETGYPKTELNMAYFFPALSRKYGRKIGAADTMQSLDGKQWQRWSRHRTSQNPWKAGEDDLGSQER